MDLEIVLIQQILIRLEVLRSALNVSKRDICLGNVLMKKLQEIVVVVAEEEEEVLKHALNVERKDICQENVQTQDQAMEEEEEIDLH